MLTGISIGGAAPLTYSMLADLVPARKRPAIASVVIMALGIGIVAGQMLAGFMGPVYGWRVPFVIVTIPNLMVAVLFLLTTKEPKRGQFDEQKVAPQENIRSVEVFTNLLKIPTNRILLIQGMLGTLPWAMIFVFLNDYLAQDCGMGVKTATLLLGVLGLSSLLGIGCGGLLGTKLYARSPHLLPWGCLLPTALAPWPLLFLLNPGIESLWIKVILAVLTGFLGSCAVPNLRAILLEINLSSNRGSMTALMTLADDLGKGLGASLIAAMAIFLGREFCFYGCALAWFGCAGTMFFLLKSFVVDLGEDPDLFRQGETV
jgi:predicted MFS family arabinose efflux permease